MEAGDGGVGADARRGVIGGGAGRSGRAVVRVVLGRDGAERQRAVSRSWTLPIMGTLTFKF